MTLTSATWRKVPATQLTVVSTNPIRGQEEAVVSRQFIPASARIPGDGCIVPTMGMLILTLESGAKRHYGFDDARITASLEMVVTRNEWTPDPESCRDEVIRKQWPVADPITGDTPKPGRSRKSTFDLYWSPEGRKIATVRAVTMRQAIRLAPAPYRKYLGEIYAVKLD